MYLPSAGDTRITVRSGDAEDAGRPVEEDHRDIRHACSRRSGRKLRQRIDLGWKWVGHFVSGRRTTCPADDAEVLRTRYIGSRSPSMENASQQLPGGGAYFYVLPTGESGPKAAPRGSGPLGSGPGPADPQAERGSRSIPVLGRMGHWSDPGRSSSAALGEVFAPCWST